MGKHRLFVAIPLGEEQKKHCREFREHLSDLNGLRWTQDANLHVTLVFLGLVEAENIPVVQANLAEMASQHSPFHLTPQLCGPSPVKKNSPMIWVTFHPNQDYTNLALNLRKKLHNFTESPDSRPPLAHITLARPGIDSPGHDQIPRLEMDFCPFLPVNQIELWESVQGEEGSVYSSLGIHLLGEKQD
ncbi:MAG: RNA 2',3'-cyclic phosphodiesterase [Bacteroidia bacterium]|nr:RNA 2',3'-cyclic phosphodiesterase [Bacteroidia bacterium]